MSIEKNMNARIQHKHDIEANWNKALNFIPKAGEIIIYDIDENHNYSRFKIGDGIRTINNLEFSQTDLTGYATESYVNSAVASLVNTAPEVLNTLDELAAALGDDPNFATTVATEIGKKVDKVDGKGLSTNDFTNEYKEKLDGLENITFEESDPTVPAWAKAATKPTYTKDEVGLGNVTNESKATMFTNPTFTGTPIAPTAAAGTNTTQVATTAFVNTAVNNLASSTKVNTAKKADEATKTTNSLTLKSGSTNLEVFNGSATGSVDFVAGSNITLTPADGKLTIGAKIPTSLKNPKSLTIGSKTYDGSSAVSISASDLGLSNALHFIGTVTSLPSTGTNGDVVLMGSKEYVYSDGWVELGDGNSHALKTIVISAGNGLTGGGDLTANRTISHADTSSQASITASGRKYITGVTLDGYGHVTGLTTGTETVTDTNTTYDLAASKSSANGNVKVNLTAGGSGSGTDSVIIKGSGATTVTTDANGVITVSSTDTNTTYTFNGAISPIKDSNLTANRALISNSSGKVAVSDITSTELGYLDGVTSNIQTQLDEHNHSASDITSGTINAARLPTAGSSLGLVKSGGDVTISNGVITVNDNSHNHTNYLPLTGGVLSNTSTSERIPVLTIQNTHKDGGSDVVIDNEGVVSCNAISTKPHGWAIINARDESTDELLAALQLNRNTHEFIIREYCMDNPNYYEGYYLPAPDNNRTYSGVYNILTTKNQVTIEQGGTGAKNATDALKNFGLTATAAELNYCDGVTSNIQTQINSKVPTSRTVNGKALSSNISLSASDVGADASGTASNLITSHNTNTGAHADIRAQINQLSVEIADKMQLAPEYANSIEECTDTSKIYVLPDGYLYAYMATFGEEEIVPLYTNWLPIATNPDGSIYDTDGYKENTRLSVSSGYFEERTESGWCATGLIPAKSGDVIRLKNCVWTKSTTAKTHRGGVFGADAAGEWVCNIGMRDITKDGSAWSPVYDSDGDNILQITIQSGWQGEYIRIVCQQFTSDSIITVNEEIVEGTVGGNVEYLNVLDDVGYIKDKRLSQSGGYSLADQAGVYLTGYIPIRVGDTFYFENMQIPYVFTTGYDQHLYFFDNNKVGYGHGHVSDYDNDDGILTSDWETIDGTNYLKSFTFKGGSYGGVAYTDGFVRINAFYIDDSSIININKLSSEARPKYTNFVKSAQAPDSTEVYNGIGYKHDTYVSSSSGHKESVNDNISTATGLMPFELGKTYYVGGGQFLPAHTECRVTMYTADKTLISQVDANQISSKGTYASLSADGNYFSISVTDSAYSSAKYFAIVLYMCDKPVVSDVDFINLPYDNSAVVPDAGAGTYGWNNTGHAFVPVDYEDRVVAFERKMSSVTSNVNVLTDRVEALESGSVNNEELPEYWVSHLESRANDIRLAMENAGRNKSSFLWYTDAHWNYGSQMSPKLLSYLYQHTPINKVNFGGDIVNNEPTDISDRETMKYLWEWRDLTRELPNHHSVIGNHDDGNTTNKLFPESYIYAFLLAPEENNDIVIGDGFYYYMDDKPEKTRYLYLDTAYNCYSNNDAAQTAFVKESLKSTPAGWHIVAISHIWVQMDYTVNPAVPKDFSAPAKALLDIFDAYNARTGEFASCGAKVEFCIGGHTHIDLDRTSAGGIPVIITETDSRHIRSGLTYTDGTITESSINAIVADYNNNIINVIRIGRGNSRTISI